MAFVPYNYLNGTKLTDLKDLKKVSFDRNKAIDNFFNENISPTARTAGAHHREKSVDRQLGKLNKGPLLDMAMKIWKEYELCRQFVRKTIEFCDNFCEPEPKSDPVVVSSQSQEKFDKHLGDIEQKLSDWGKQITSEMKGILEKEIPTALPQVTKDAVIEISTNTKFMKPWNELFKKSQGELKEEANKTFRATLKTALNESQQEIISKVQQKHDVDMFERDRRVCNFVIENCEESNAPHAPDRLKHDIEFVKSVTGIDDSDIVKCVRAGPKKDPETGEMRTSRPIIVTVKSPDIAKQLHGYGNGKKVISKSKCWWINPDLTQAERRANFNARQQRRIRLKSIK